MLMDLWVRFCGTLGKVCLSIEKQVEIDNLGPRKIRYTPL